MTSGKRQEFWKKGIVKIVILLGGLYAAMRHLAKKQIEPESINQENPYISSCGNDNQDGQRQKDDGQKRDVRKTASIYRNRIKPFLDRLLSFIALVLLAPVFAVIALAVYVDDPGPVFFTQTRVGKNKNFFSLHKFRSMKMSTPHDVPTHQLKNPEQYITKVGRVLRKTSLDELPQIWDIFRGKMSIIGPRPALWNQEDLVTEREKYGANDVMPGLTGWAQINGRDELEIEEKAKLDGVYAKKLKSGGITAFFFDVKCFVKTIQSIIYSEGIVEGGTGELYHKKNELDIASVKEEKIKVSVITPAYNAQEYLAACIKSVQAQSYGNWEMIIVDDCSQDSTYKIAAEFAKEDNRIKVVRHSINSGVSSARNTALEMAEGNYIAFLDSDDLWEEKKLYKQLCFMEKGKYVLSYTAYRKLDVLTGKMSKIIKIPKKMNRRQIYGNTAIACLTVMVNRDVIGDFRMPLINHAEDQCTWQEIIGKGYNSYGLNDSLAIYRTGNSSLTCDKYKSAKMQWNVYRKYHKFGRIKSLFYFCQYSVNAVFKYM